ncbi:trigger factor [Permianibacter sp. IMCC34836]|uniref:trigger factor n=1 Tax=Permianibacter fluminis TaxID=2738515 RepID=UPI001554F49F|nr:trigger factor [Permianibacter fluminis]NQD38713.1 trigger factor [Permianibacter fluminis]
MQVSVEVLNGLERRVTIGVPAESIESEISKRLQQLSRSQRLPGFRPGKLPMNVVNQRWGDTVRREVWGDTMQRSFYEAVMKEKLNPAGNPRIEPKKLEAGKDVEFVATFEVYPEFTVAGLDKIAVEKPIADVTDADVETMLETLRKQRSSWAVVERAAKDGDQVTIDFVGTVDGQAFEGGSANGVKVVIGSNSMIPGFEEGLVGAKAGGSVELNVTFPEDYGNADLAGKAAVFKVTVGSISEQKLPELDDAFVALFGLSSGGVDALKVEVRKNMTRELRQVIKNKIKAQVMDGLVKENSISLPTALVDQEIERLRQQANRELGMATRKKDLPELPASLFSDQAKRRVSLGLIVGEVIRANKIEADGNRVRTAVEDIASAYETPSEVVNWYYANKRELAQMEALVLEDQVVDFVLAKAQVTEKQVSFDELMNKRQ